MKPDQTALILEGGGFRGIYTSGVLDVMMAHELEIPYVIGVSMGAVNGANYISKQPGRSFEMAKTFMPDKRYMGVGNLIREGNFFGREFAYNEIPRRYNLFDMKTYYASKQLFYMVATDCRTGKAAYFEKMDCEASEAIAASTALPFLSRMVPVGEGLYLDGGMADSVPIKKALEDGCEKAVLVLTREKGYRKEPYSREKLLHARYGRYPLLEKAILERHLHYNETMEWIDQLEEEGRVFVIRPENPIETKVIDRDRETMEKSYRIGYDQMTALWDDLMTYLQK